MPSSQFPGWGKGPARRAGKGRGSSSAFPPTEGALCKVFQQPKSCDENRQTKGVVQAGTKAVRGGSARRVVLALHRLCGPPYAPPHDLSGQKRCIWWPTQAARIRGKRLADPRDGGQSRLFGGLDPIAWGLQHVKKLVFRGAWGRGVAVLPAGGEGEGHEDALDAAVCA